MSRDILDTERPFHTEHFIQLLEQSEDPQDVLNDVVQVWLSDGTDTGDKGDLYFKFHKDGDPGENASHKLLDFDGNVFADGYMFADKANVGGIEAVADGTVALDMTQGNVFTVTTSQNTSWSTSAPTNGVGGQLASFVVDNAGGYTVAWGSGFTDIDSIAAADTGIHGRLIQFDGTTWHQLIATEDGAILSYGDVGNHGDPIFQGVDNLAALTAELGNGYYVLNSRGPNNAPVWLDILALIQFITGGESVARLFTLAVTMPTIAFVAAASVAASESASSALSVTMPTIAMTTQVIP